MTVEMDVISAGPAWQADARDRFNTLLADLGGAIGSERSRLLESLNSGLRRLRESSTVDEVAQRTVELTTPYASRLALFLFSDEGAEAAHAKNLGLTPIALNLDEAPAFRAAIESHDPVIAVGLPSEITADLSTRIGFESSERVYLFPLSVRGAVQSLIFSAGDVDSPALELIAGMAATRMEALAAPPVPKRADLVSIAGAKTPLPESKNGWSELSPEDQALHLKAQRFARLRTAEMRIEHGDAFRRGIDSNNLYETLRDQIDRAREEFRRIYAKSTPTMVDYLYLEMVRSLAENDDRRLGPGFPGPVVTAK